MVESRGVIAIRREKANEKIRDYWKDAGEEYDNYHGFDTEEEEKEWEKFLSSEVSGNKLKILDAGTGTGFLALLLTEQGHDVVGIDLSDGMMTRARKKAKER